MDVTIKNILLQELAQRQSRNSAYSLRAFARDLQIGVTTLSDVLGNRRSLSKTNLLKVIEVLMLSPLEKDRLWSQYQNDSRKKIDTDERILLDEDTFRLIADWQYLAILSLAKLPTNKAGQPAWIAKRIGIKVEEASTAIERLLRLGLVRRTKGKLSRTAAPLTTSSDIPSAAIRRHHQQNLLLAEKSLQADSVERREFGSVTMAVNPEKLPQAKQILLNTRKKIASLLEQGQVSEVYTLSFQLFPLTKGLKNTGVEK